MYMYTSTCVFVFLHHFLIAFLGCEKIVLSSFCVFMFSHHFATKVSTTYIYTMYSKMMRKHENTKKRFVVCNRLNVLNPKLSKIQNLWVRISDTSYVSENQTFGLDFRHTKKCLKSKKLSVWNHNSFETEQLLSVWNPY